MYAFGFVVVSSLSLESFWFSLVTLKTPNSFAFSHSIVMIRVIIHNGVNTAQKTPTKSNTKILLPI